MEAQTTTNATQLPTPSTNATLSPLAPVIATPMCLFTPSSSPSLLFTFIADLTSSTLYAFICLLVFTSLLKYLSFVNGFI